MRADNEFHTAYVDVDEWRDTPVRHRYVHGGFNGTDTRFSFYLPPAEQYEGRFFQHVTPVPDSEHLAQGATGEEDKIGFCHRQRRLLRRDQRRRPVRRCRGPRLGPDDRAPTAPMPPRPSTPESSHWRCTASTVPTATLYGGSGGGFRTIGGAENTSGVWDGVVPYVIGSPIAIPNVFTVRMHALRVLRDRFTEIVDAVDAGGAGDRTRSRSTDDERDVLLEVTAWASHPDPGSATRPWAPRLRRSSSRHRGHGRPAYFDDFWTEPGYLGHDRRPRSSGDIASTSEVAAAIDAAGGTAARGSTWGTTPGRPTATSTRLARHWGR